jgi:hypothetical protein
MRYAYIQTDTPRDNQRRPLNASRKSLRLIALTAALAASCTQAPSGREVHWRAADILYADSAPVPLSTADYPREEINSDTRVVLKEFKSFPRNGKTVEHGRLTVDIPEGAVIQLAYGLRPLRRKAVLPPDASATFRVALTSKQGERSLFEDTIHNGEPGAGSWKDALISSAAMFRPAAKRRWWRSSQHR